MMHNGDYAFGGMHIIWWLLLAVSFLMVMIWLFRFRKGKGP